MRLMLQLFCTVVLGLGSAVALSDSSDLLGDWDIVTTGFAFGGATSHVDLSIEEKNGELVAYVYDGPVPLRVDGDQFEFDLDWNTAFDTVHLSRFAGRLNEAGELEGEVDHRGDRNFLGDPMPGGNFTGRRGTRRVVSNDAAPEPVDFGGVWNRAFGLGAVRKMNYTMTDEGQAIVDNYDEMDNGNSRCASMGLVMASGMPYPMEIMPSEDHILIVYGADYVRRIYLDGREFPDTATSSSLGFSTGEWKGDTLVVKTTKLNPTFMSTRGQPVSADAYTIEHFYMDDKGYLHADMWLHDSENYAQPPYIRRVMDRDFTPTVITKVGCDPYSFFRALYLDGKLDEFWGRATLRR